MKNEDRYLKFVRWSDEDRAYVGYCPDLFPWGGVCHGATEEVAYRKLRLLVREEVAQLHRKGKSLPPISTRPMRDAVVA
ncbi:MAG TPA: hypothetical protein VIK52_08790 [Opitutaceae bacterium]